jgi:uncharacterized YccA/Bax inhibitor family protein
LSRSAGKTLDERATARRRPGGGRAAAGWRLRFQPTILCLNPGTKESPVANVMLNDKTFTGPAAATVETTDRMTIGGTILRSAVLTTVALVFGTVGWNNVGVILAPSGGLIFLLVFLGLIGLSFVAARNPRTAVWVGPIYAVVVGVWAGAISRVYEQLYQGVVPQAVLATISVLAVTLALYSLRIVRVTPRFVQVVMAATLGVLGLYLVNIAAGFFGASFIVPSALGIAISVVTSLVAAFNLFLDFHFVEQGVNAGAPKYMEWYSAFGLVATIVWLYLELLRLLSFFRN